MDGEKRVLRSQKVRYKDTIVEIATVILNEIECLRLCDVQRRFPSVSVLCVDNIQLSFICDKDGNDLIPLRIEVYPNKIVEGFQSIEQANVNVNDRLESISIDLEDVRRTNKLILANTQTTLVRLKHLMTQMYQLQEFTTPRYFFILPTKQNQLAVFDDFKNLFILNYKLYFLCECSDEIDQLHVAPHQGYSITKPNEFIRKYGSYLRTTLTVARTLLIVGGFAIPQLGNVSTTIANTLVPTFDKVTKANLTDKFDLVEKVLDGNEHRLSWIDRNDSSERDQFLNTPIQGAQLRELESYLKSVDNQNSLGNLYRTVTDDGQVRWVCFQHFNSIEFHRKMSDYIRQFESLGGQFNQFRNEAILYEIHLTTKNIYLFSDSLTKGFNISSISFTKCSFNEKDFDKLFDIIINRSSIRSINLSNITINSSQWLRISKSEYICGSISIQISNHLFKIHFWQNFTFGDMKLLNRLIFINQICRTLHLLGVDFCQYGKDIRQCLQSNQQITTLIINYSNQIQFLLDLLSMKSSINNLKFNFCLISSSSLSQFCQVLSKNCSLVELHLVDYLCFDDQYFTIELLNVLRHHKSIKRVTLHIYHVHLNEEKETNLIEILLNYSFISQLNLSQSIISNRLIQSIVHAFKTNNSLNRLECYDCQIEDNDLEILQSININDNLILSKEQYWSLTLQQFRQQFQLENVGYENATIKQLIQQEKSHSEINFYKQNLIDRDIELIIKEAIEDKQCVGLYLGSNSLTTIAISILAHALISNQTLDRLWLFDNQIYDQGIYFLCQTLSNHNKHLTKLDLGKTGITDQGIQYISQMIQTNQTLIRLYLTQNQITDIGVQLLAKTIQQQNSTIKTLHLSQNIFLTDLCLDSIISMIEQNQSIEDFRISECNLSENGKQKLNLIAKQKNNNFKIWT